MKKYLKENKNKIIRILTIIWVFLAPFQIYLNKGVSFSLAMIVLAVIALILFSTITPIWKWKVIKRVLLRNKVIFILIFITIISGLVNKFLGSFQGINIKEIARWILFYIELLVMLEIYRAKVVSIKDVVKSFIASALVMLLFSTYQIFISQKMELTLVSKYIGNIFNDPELIAEKIRGIGKFNWMYGDATRVHGVFANVSQFGFLLGSAYLLLITHFSNKWKSYYLLGGSLLFAFVVLSLVRSALLPIIGILFLVLCEGIYKKNFNKFFRMLSTMVFGGILAIALAWFSYEKILFYACIARVMDLITIDGAISISFIQKYHQYYDKINISNDGFDEYGGVGGRYNLLLTTYNDVIRPNLRNVFFWLFGFGPGSLGVLLKKAENSYFKAFNTVDNSYLQWIVELGVLPFITLTGFILASFKEIKKLFLKNWILILFILFNALFFDLLPDIRMGMITAILLATIFNNYGFED